MAAQTLTRPNRYTANCIRCHARIPAGEGLLVRCDDGTWAADHPADCPPTTVGATAAPVQRVTEDGIYRAPDGTIYKVQIAKQGSGQLYAKRLHLTDGKGTFVYVAGAIHTLRADWRMTLEQAAEFGKLYGVCIRCGRDLTDEESIARGIGPVCAGLWA
jgi:hypothetical protein